MENNEIKNVTEETMVAEEVVEETKTNFLTKVGSSVKKNWKKVAVAGAAVAGVGLLVAKAVLSKNNGDDYEPADGFLGEDDFEEPEVSDEIE